ncbi:MAG TPA: dTDP-4-dehydrorhamnose reductase [Polyangiaceae bacterium]|nr:dTDP-4-dehydrorhamnose reductase [Polyangiaceae bacterium]
MRLLIFGGGGQLGRELSREATRTGLVSTSFEHGQVSITDAALVSETIATSDTDFVVNAAAYTAVDRAESESDRAFEVNRDGPRHLARACAQRGIPLLHVSTDYVFDGSKASAYVEDDPIQPLGVYGASKAAGEAAVRDALREHFILRTSWVFSAFGNNFVKTMLRLARERDELRVVADQHGRPTATRDLALAILEVVRQYRSGGRQFGTFHFANAGGTTWYEFANAIVQQQAPLTGRAPRVVPITTAEYPTPARRPANSELDTSRFERAFAHSPRHWRAGLAEVLDELLGARAT